MTEKPAKAQPLKILLFAKQPAPRTRIAEQFGRSVLPFDLHVCSSAETARQKLQDREWDFFILNLDQFSEKEMEFRGYVAEHFPAMVRIELTGAVDMGLAVHALPLAHQLVTAGGSAGSIVELVIRLQQLRELVADARFRAVLNRIRQLPSMPQSYLRIENMLRQEDYQQTELVDLLGTDLAISAQLLKAANSAFFGARKVASLYEAVTLLGAQVIKAIVLAAEVFAGAQQGPTKRMMLERLWEHALQTGSFAAAIAAHQKLPKTRRDEALTAGILHDVGKILFIMNFQYEYEEVGRLTDRQGLLSYEAERKVLGTSHQEVGAYLLGLWGVPDIIVRPVGCHHQLLKDTAPADCAVAADVAAANIYTRKETPGKEFPDWAELQQYLKKCGAKIELPAKEMLIT